jgi:6-phospho-beta-glucosidase
MKLCIIGGGGVRGPLLLLTLARRRQRYDIEDVTVFDVDGRKTAVMAELARAMIAREGLDLRWRVCDSAREALSRRDAIITTIREGFEEGRARDERVCLDAGVIGQETTGAAGFAYAVRSVPAICEYVAIAGDRSPEAWILNFTNPAGLVAQAMKRDGHPRVVGICDSADNAQKFAARHLGVPRRSVKTTVFGLNHLSWTSEVVVGPGGRETRDKGRGTKDEALSGHPSPVVGRDVLPRLLADDAFMSLAQNVFDPETPRRLGLFCNEYLFYWYRSAEALAALRAEEECRGELVLRLNRDLLSDVKSALLAGDRDGAMKRCDAYHHDRAETYMAYARADGAPAHEFEIEGYAGVALDFLDSLHGEGVRMALNVPNEGARDEGRGTTDDGRRTTEDQRGTRDERRQAADDGRQTTNDKRQTTDDRQLTAEHGSRITGHGSRAAASCLALDFLRPDDVVEVTCEVGGGAYKPVAAPRMPVEVKDLIVRVKEYERIAIESIERKSRDAAIAALTIHPLVGGEPKAVELYRKFADAQPRYFLGWK